MKGARIAMLKTPRLKPGKRLVGLMLLWAVLIPIGVVLTACAAREPTPTPTVPAATIVTFPDKNLEAAIRDALGKPPGEEIRAGELAELTELDATERHIADLTGIEHLSNLTVLGLSSNQISDISPLASLSNLSTLDLFNNRISDISPLASLSNLTVLGLGENQITDISPLVENRGLGEGDGVWLGNNNLDLSEGSEDLENIRALENRGVVVYHEPIMNPPGSTFRDPRLEAAIRGALGKPPGGEITAGELAQLKELVATRQHIADLTGIEHLSNLSTLRLSRNRISDISPLSSLSNLNLLNLTVNQISDISPLVENSGLGQGDFVLLENTNLDLSEGSEDLENIRKLEERGVRVTR